jgi:hypothetical protein
MHRRLKVFNSLGCGGSTAPVRGQFVEKTMIE